MKRIVFVRSALIIALLLPATLLFANKRPSAKELTKRPTASELEEEFFSTYRNLRIETQFEPNNFKWRTLPCTADESALALEAILESLDASLDCAKVYIKLKLTLHWTKLIHPFDERKQIWVAWIYFGGKDSVVAKARIGF